ERTPVPGLARRLSLDRTARLLLMLRSFHPHYRFDVQPTRQVAEGLRRYRMAPADRLVELPLVQPRLAAGSQWLFASGPGLHRPCDQQEGRGRARLSAAGRQLPPIGYRTLPAEPQLRKRDRRRQAGRAAVADDGPGDQTLYRRPRHLGMGEQRPWRSTRCRDGVLRRRPDARNPRRRRTSAPAHARAESPSDDYRQREAATGGERASS